MKKAKKIMITILTLLLVILIVSGFVIYGMMDSVNRKILVDEHGNPLDREGKGIGINAPNKEDTGVINILLLGVDKRTNETPRSDTMIIASIDKKNKSIKLTSVMRDTWIPIPGRSDNRINTAFLYGGPALAIKTVNTNFNLDIEDYIAVDFEAFKDIIDVVGGVEIDVKQKELWYVNKEIQWQNSISNKAPSPTLTSPGLQTLDGCQALAYSRIRKVGNSDWERTARQREVLNQVFKKSKEISITKVPNLVNKILPKVETSLSSSQIIDLGISIMNYRKNEIEQFRIPADGAYTDEYKGKLLVIVPDMQKNKDMLHEFIYGPKKNDTNQAFNE